MRSLRWHHKLLGDGQGFVDRQRAGFEPIRERLPFDGSSTRKSEPFASSRLLAAMFGWLRRARTSAFALEQAHPVPDHARTPPADFDRDITLQLRVARAVYLAFPRPQDGRNLKRRFTGDRSTTGGGPLTRSTKHWMSFVPTICAYRLSPIDTGQRVRQVLTSGSGDTWS